MGHDLEKTYTQQLIIDCQNSLYPFGDIEQISEVGLGEKVDKKYVKDSIDRLVGYIPKDKVDEKILLYEMKARVAPNTAQKERERILQYHDGEKYVSTHSNSPNSWNYISDPKERLQVLHHCYTYEQTSLLHVAGDTQGILSAVLIDIDTELLELSLIHI